MKILVPYKDVAGRSIHDKVCSGGIERFIRHLLHDIRGVDVLDISQIYRDPDLVAEIISKRMKDYDLMICNYPNEGLNVRLRDHKKVAWICHNTVGLDPRWRTVATNMRYIAEAGGSLWMVSANQLSGWAREFPALAKLCRGFVYPGYVKKRDPVEGTIPVVTLGRCQRMKDPFKLHRLSDKGMISYVMTNSTGRSDDREYEEENRHWSYPHITVWNPRDEEVDLTLSKASSFMVTWGGETFGIAAMEALSFGVPIVIASNGKDHACLELIDTKDHGTAVREEEAMDAVSIYNTWTLNMRKQIAAAAYGKFNMYEWKLNIRTMLEMSAP